MSKVAYFVKCCRDTLELVDHKMQTCKCGASSVDGVAGAYVRFLGDKSNFMRLNEFQLEIEKNRSALEAEAERLKDFDGNIVAYNMVSGKDFWSELAEKLNMPRQAAKALYHGFNYSPRWN